MKFLGKQYMVELQGCNAELLDDPSFIGEAMTNAALKANATIVQQFFHQFSPFGVSGTVVIAESHINIHTWPEHFYAAIDIFTCSDTLEAEKAIDYLKEILEARNCTTSMINRGQIG
ncbi:adenosylmethionine decarboxylase [Portibacter marinus]|uniref:adenosylmethionine decarboxylase n=1 Tax=Portibacter marinus TaxID=2898660 RepID=UPI001F1EBE41|nr:adenosylmethionine decarboxylase [Portibacter marinus]